MIWLIIVLNVLGWPVIQLSVSYIFLQLPEAWFAHDSWLTRERHIEAEGMLYRRVFAVHQWKDMLPDGASWLGGRSKKKIASRSPELLRKSALETRRAEVAHWCMLLCTPAFYLWNPPWACGVMSLYGLLANLPCIVAQRANRIKIARIQQSLSHS